MYLKNPSKLITLILSLILFIGSNTIMAQKYFKDRLLIKLKSGVIVKPRRMKIGKKYRYTSGIKSLDGLNIKKSVLRMEKVFNDEINNEMSQYYRIIFEDTVKNLKILKKKYLNLPIIESIKLIEIPELLAEQNHPDDPYYNFSINGDGGISQEQWYLYNDGDMNDDNVVDGEYLIAEWVYEEIDYCSGINGISEKDCIRRGSTKMLERINQE